MTQGTTLLFILAIQNIVQLCFGLNSSFKLESKVTTHRFNEACKIERGIGGNDQYQGFMNSLSQAGILELPEALYYLSFCIYESKGLSELRDAYCLLKENQEFCADQYESGPNGVIYFGRGPLRLHYKVNYQIASQVIFGNASVLLEDPDMVARDLKTAWATAAWIWKEFVHLRRVTTFGQVIRAINYSDCKGGRNEQNMWLRCDSYRKMLEVFNIPLPNREIDCECKAPPFA